MGISRQVNGLYAFGSFSFDPNERVLLRDGEPVPLPPRIAETLLLLLENAGHLVDKEQLMKRVWPDTFVEEGNLNKNIFLLRKTLGQWNDSREYIETIPKRGYRFVATVSRATESQRRIQFQAGARRSKIWRLAAVGTCIVAVGGLALLGIIGSKSHGPHVVRFSELTNDGHPKVGPLRTDGTRVYFTEDRPFSENPVLQVSVKGGETIPVQNLLKEPHAVDLSEDRTELLIVAGESFGPPSVWIQPVAGGAPRRVNELVVDSAIWGPDIQTITYTKGSDIYVVRRDGTGLRRVVSVPGIPSDLRFSPDRTKLRFTLADNLDHSTSLWEVNTDGRDPHPLLSGWNTPASECCGSWTNDGRYFVFQSTQNGRTDIWAFEEKGAFLRARLKPQQLTSGPMNFSDPIATDDGRQLYAIGTLTRAELVRYDSKAHKFESFLGGISAEGLDFSRDGKWVTYTSYPNGTLWRSKVDGSERLQLTFQPMRVFLPRWSPDGKQIAFMGSPPSAPWKIGGPWKIYLISTDGGSPTQLLPGEEDEADPTWSADGNHIVFGGLRWANSPIKQSVAMKIQVVDLNRHTVSKLPGSDGLCSPRWSPDGRYIVAFTAAHPMAPKLFDFTTRDWTSLANSEMGYASWSRDSRHIYLQDWNNGHPRIARLRLTDRKLEGVMDFNQVPTRMVGTITAWSGLTIDGYPLVARDLSNQEIYALQVQLP